MTKNSLTALTLAITLSLGATASLSAAPVHAKPAPSTTANHSATMSAEQQQLLHADTLAQNGREAMSYIVAANQLLTDQHADEARQYLEKAKGLLTEIKSEIDTEKNNPDGLLSIYSQLGIHKEIEVTEPVKQQLQKIYPNVIRGKHKQVVEQLKTVDIELQYSFVDMPVAATLGKVEFALKSLSAKDSQQASQALADAQQGLIQDSIIVNAVDENPAG
ncbi:MAG: YfdX family protein [Gammaproteobacteria bacterium]|nr:YfdX family protein [Gammaproteobacteria bacterium]